MIIYSTNYSLAVNADRVGKTLFFSFKNLSDDSIENSIISLQFNDLGKLFLGLNLRTAIKLIHSLDQNTMKTREIKPNLAPDTSWFITYNSKKGNILFNASFKAEDGSMYVLETYINEFIKMLIDDEINKPRPKKNV